MTLRISRMTSGDLKVAVDWAAAEGWNPGLEDADAFQAVDPDGFLMGWLDDVPVTAISVVRHSESFGFLGFYLCHPDHRGKGFGMATWQAGMAHLVNRTVGLDGVPAQEGNYGRSGFRLSHYTRRFSGHIDGRTNAECRPATGDDMPGLLAMDLEISATSRSAYLSGWCTQTATRKTLVFESDGQITGFGTIRACREGHKIGPLFAPEPEIAGDLILALVAEAAANRIFIDVPDPNGAGVRLVESMEFEPVFSCARMYRGNPLIRQTGRIFGETSFELG